MVYEGAEAQDAVYDDYGRQPGGSESGLFLYDPVLDPTWPMPEPGAFDERIPVDDFGVDQPVAREEAPVVIAPLPRHLEPGFADDGDPAPRSDQNPGSAPGQAKPVAARPSIQRALEAARAVTPKVGPAPRTAQPPSPEEAALGLVPVEELPSPLEDIPVEPPPFGNDMGAW